MNLRRLESEIIRDSILAVSGALDRTAGGPPVEITTPPDGLSEAKAAPASLQRRSVYLFARRIYPLKFLEIFDAPIMPVNCMQRVNSATVLQSLALLNSEFLFDQADRMAALLSTTAGADSAAAVELAFRLALAQAQRCRIEPQSGVRQRASPRLRIDGHSGRKSDTDGPGRSLSHALFIQRILVCGVTRLCPSRPCPSRGANC